MQRPAILALDDDGAVLRAVARDLRHEYGRKYRIVAAQTGESALEELEQMSKRGEAVALFVVDQRMPGMSGIEFLGKAAQIFPDAGRVLLTAYADKDAAIRAINEVALDHYLLKPWDPPEEKLYPVVSDLLEDWRAHAVLPFEGIKLLGHRWSPAGHQLRSFLARNLVPYRWMDVDESPEAERLLGSGEPDPGQLPLVIFPDGSRESRPTVGAIAEKIGLQTRPDASSYDLVIVGAGPAGLAASVYGASEGLGTLLLESEAPGGQAGLSSRIENYLGFPVGLSGSDLARRAVAQARRLGAEILTPVEACGLRVEGDYRVIECSDGSELTCQALIIATGVSYRILDVPGADQVTGAGIYYGAAIPEAGSVRGKDVFVVGGGNSAGQAAMYLSGHARSVTLLVRRDSLAKGMSQYLIAQIEETENIAVRTSTSVTRVGGKDHLEELTLLDSATGESETVPTEALFVFIGSQAQTDWLGESLERDHRGLILTGADLMRGGERPRGWNAPRDPLWLEGSVPGIFVAGDVRHGSTPRVASAVGEGAMAVRLVHMHLNSPSLPIRPRPRRRATGRTIATDAPP